MKKELIKISSENPVYKLKINPEEPKIAVTYKDRRSNSLESDSVSIAIVQFTVEFFHAEPIVTNLIISNVKEAESKDFLYPKVDDSNVKSLEIELITCTLDGFEIDLIIQSGRDLIDIKNPLESFHRHLNDRANTKILFSGPFGQGKTTFLDHYFYGENAVNDKFEVFKVFPVNYSVASNEDIFKYIKTDILFQLLAKDVEFDKSEISLISSFEEYIYLNPKKTIFTFLKNVSHLNAKTEAIAKVVESLNEFMKRVFAYQKENSVDGKELAFDYLKDIYEKEGSLFEDNFYTQLIRQLLEKLVTDTKKENVLIIEDLDRMDPDHIFRILNVISAHYDNYNFNGNENHHNKFGFDKIILVCDVNNIENIFHHKYGEKTDFAGYMNKYYSTSPFKYDNQLMITSSIDKLFSLIQTNERNLSVDGFKLLLKSLIGGNELTLREILKISKTDFSLFKVKVHDHYYANGMFTKSIALLIGYFDAKNLIIKFEDLKNRNFKIEQVNYSDISTTLIATLSNKRNENFVYEHNGCVYELEIGTDYNNNVMVKNINVIVSKTDKTVLKEVVPNFTHIDFYDLLIENIKRYNQLENL